MGEALLAHTAVPATGACAAVIHRSGSLIYVALSARTFNRAVVWPGLEIACARFTFQKISLPPQHDIHNFNLIQMLR